MAKKMSWLDLFKNYCTLSDENKTPKGVIKEYSTKGTPLHIHWTYKEPLSEDVKSGEMEKIVFIQHFKDLSKSQLHPISVIHYVTCIDESGTEYFFEIHEDTAFRLGFDIEIWE